MVRAFITILLPIIFLYPLCPLYLIERFIVGKINPEAMYKSSQTMIRWLFRFMLIASGVKVELKGLENVPEDTAVLYTANHRSYYDIMILYLYAKGSCGIISKKEMGRYPMVKPWLDIIRVLLLDRDNLREGMKTILEGVELMKGGTSMIIYPEGTRVKTEKETDMLPFHGGSFKLATKSGCPVVPVAISGTAEIFEKHMPFVRPGHVTVTYLEPIPTKGMAREEEQKLPERVQELIRHELELPAVQEKS